MADEAAYERTLTRARPAAAEHARVRETNGRTARLIAEAALAHQVPATHGLSVGRAAATRAARLDGSPDEWRADRTRTTFVAIDPPDALDRDDAIACEPDEDGWRLAVAVTDLAALVPHGGILDRYLARRGTSHYLPDRTLTMCPPALAAAEALRTGARQRALVTTMRIAPDGTLAVEEAMRPGWIRLTAAVDHPLADRWIESRDEDEPNGPNNDDTRVRATVRALADAGAARRAGRIRTGAVMLPNNEELILGRDPAGHPAPGHRRMRGPAERAVEEAMLAAGACAAQAFSDGGVEGAVFRAQPPPHAVDVELAVREARLERVITEGEPGERLRATANAEARDGPTARLRANAIRRALPRAFVAGTGYPHYALGLPTYLQTTSPLRRYADLRNQQCAHAWHGTPGAPRVARSARLVDLLAEHEEVRRALARETQRIWHAAALRATPERTGPGTITGVIRHGAFVELDHLPGIDGFAHVSELADEWINEAGHALVGEDTGRRWAAGQRVEATLTPVPNHPWKVSARIKDRTEG